MADLYYGFSNYDEINIENRKKAVQNELSNWEQQAEDFKAYREEWNRAANTDYTPERPLHVDIELSDACNLKCQMCAHGLGTVKDVGLIDEALAKRLVDECVEIGVKSIKYNWRGEASLHKILPEMVGYAKKQGILEVQINTNGQPPKSRKDCLIDCAENGIDRIIFSIDGHSKKTYETIRRGSDYFELMENIQNLLDWKIKTHAKRPLIRVQMVRTNINAHEVDDFINFWQPLVDDVRISDVMDRGQGGGLAVGDQETTGRRRCPQPFQRLVVGRDGRVSPCCADWNQAYVVGNVHDQSLSQIWRGPKMKAMQNIQNKVKLDSIDICKNCYVKESFTWAKRKKVT